MSEVATCVKCKVTVPRDEHAAKDGPVFVCDFCAGIRTPLYLSDKDKVPTYAQLYDFVWRVAGYLKEGEPLDPASNDGDDTFILENDDAFETVHAVITEARTLLGIPDGPQP